MLVTYATFRSTMGQGLARLPSPGAHSIKLTRKTPDIQEKKSILITLQRVVWQLQAREHLLTSDSAIREGIERLVRCEWIYSGYSRMRNKCLISIEKDVYLFSFQFRSQFKLVSKKTGTRNWNMLLCWSREQVTTELTSRVSWLVPSRHGVLLMTTKSTAKNLWSTLYSCKK